MGAKEALVLVGIALAVLGSLASAFMSWQQVRSKQDALGERLTEMRAEVKELRESRDRHVARFMEIEGEARATTYRLEALISGDISRPIKLGRPRGGEG